MLNKNFNKIISILLTMIFITGIFPPVIFAQPNPFGEVKGFNRIVIDSHFSKADRELTPERWLEEAKFGVTQAICAWEFIAINLYENPVIYEDAKTQLVKWSDEELEKRFSQWLTGRFFGKAAEEALLKLSQMFNESQKNYSWHLDDEGNVIFDDKTGDPLVIRPDEEGREFSRDLVSWRNDTNEIVKNTNASFNNVIIKMYPELMAYIPIESRDSINAIINETLNYQNGAIKKEFENIAAREERIFTNRRTRDIWSLRKKSDDEAAKVFTEKLIAQTDESCKKGIEELNRKIEQAAAGTGDLALLGEEWLRLYTEQFERGLKAWEEAEERFFIRRIEWEQESFKLFSEGEEIWLSAFTQFEEERQKWELNAKELFQTGETLFKNISKDFEKTIAEAKKEFELNAAIRLGEGTNKVKALIDMYLVCASTAISSIENIKFWQKQYGDSEKDIKEPDFQNWISQNIENLWKQAESSYLLNSEYIRDTAKLEELILQNSPENTSDLSPNQILSLSINLRIFTTIYNKNYSELFLIQEILKGEMTLPEQIALAKNMNNKYFSKIKFEALVEIQNCYDIYLKYTERSLDARDRIYENYAELFGTGALKDILSSDVSSDDFYLDEYQIALIRAKAVVLYWERKTAIADAVLAYAAELGAGRMTEAEGIRAWENAKAAYNNSLVIYETEINKLKEMGENIQKQQEIIYNLTAQMQKEEDKLSKLYSDYTMLVSASVVNPENSYLAEFNEKYNYLAEKYNQYRNAGVNSVYYSALEYGMLWEIAEQREAVETMARIEYILETNEELSEEEIEYLYNEYIALSSMLQNDLWVDINNSLSLLFENYNLESTENICPDISSLCQAIFDMSGDFAQNTARFLIDFDNCFSIIPIWLQYEIDNWKASFIEYITIYALFNNIKPENNTEELSLIYNGLLAEYDAICEKANTFVYADNELDENTNESDLTDAEIELLNNSIKEIINKLNIFELVSKITKFWETLNSIALTGDETHWRQYLIDEYIRNKDPSLTMVSTWTEGIFTDALYYANYYTNRINDSFYIYSQKDYYDTDGSAGQLYKLYSEKITQTLTDFNLLKSQYSELINASRTYTISILPPDGVKEQLLIVEENIKKQEVTFNSFRNEYYKEAEYFLDIGSQYDNQYIYLKTIYNNTDQKRFEYEKQDAIQRWASTSYINTDNIDLDNYKTNLLKAQTVLNVLSDLSNNENRISNKNPEYAALYAAYEESFTRKVKILEVMETFSSEYLQEKMNNKNYYNDYQKSLFQLGINFNYENYYLPESKDDWHIENIITVNNGRLAFSKDDSMNLIGVDSAEVNSVISFFNTAKSINGEQYDITGYEEALRGLSLRMSEYFKDPNKFMQWSYARNYLIMSLLSSNGGVKFLNNYLSLQGELAAGGSLASESIKKSIIGNGESLHSYIERTFFQGDTLDLSSTIKIPFNTYANDLFFDEWNNLSAEEKADLEFYVILTLTTGNDYFAGFSKMFTNAVYEYAYDRTNHYYNAAKKNASTWHRVLVWPLWNEAKDINNSTLNRIRPVYEETTTSVNKWINEIQNNLISVKNRAASYAASCQKLIALEGIKEDSNITWDDLKTAFLESKINVNDINLLKNYWEVMLQDNNNAYKSVFEAIIALSNWSDNEAKYTKNNLESRLSTDLQNQRFSEVTFSSAVENYFNGTSDIKTVIIAAENAYGKNYISIKNNFENMYNVAINNLSIYMNTNNNLNTLFVDIGEEIVSLTKNTILNTYNMELTAREAEWELMRKDITEKYNEWQNTAAQIFENGRIDWNESIKKLENAYMQWNLNFQNEYERVNNEWSLAYLAGLEDKEIWLQQAADAVNHASSESLLSLIGSEGERLSRFVDTREPLGIRNAIPEAHALMTGLLQSSGIVNMANTFNSINNFTSVTSPLVKRGIGGGSSWDSALVKMAASDIARESNAKIAENESKKLAYNTRIIAGEAISNLTAAVTTANQNFKESMDNMFIFKGLWRRNGNNYEKDIIKGSTLLTPLITEKVIITGYINYIMEPVSLKTNLDEKFLAGLNTIAIQGLINNVFTEVQAIANEIFGFDEEIIKINENEIEREQSPGKFGAHIGYSPAEKQSQKAVTSKNDMFYDEGAGELGRLVSDFQYWYIIDKIGSAELALAPWDKRMWDDEGSWFTSPSLRTVGTIAGSIVAGIATAGMSGIAGIALFVGLSSASEIAFGALDVTCGYKSLDEAAFTVGKSILTNTITSSAGSIFNGITMGSTQFQGLTNIASAKAATPFDAVLAKTFMTGTQTITTGIATSLISGITYNSENGFGYSGDILKASLNGMLTNALTSMASVFTTTGLTAINSGINLDKIEGFNKINKENLHNLNGFIGSLAGQGVNYALGNDFTLNVLNLSLLTGNKDHNNGLLELHFGRNGANMNIGTGGANVSIDNLISVYKGAQVWDINTKISKYGKENEFDALISLRAQYGYGDDVHKNQLWDILKGDAIINTDADGNYLAETTINEDGKRVINLAAYEKGMSKENQYLLATLLGYEAYRSGYKIGEIDASGKSITEMSQITEIENAFLHSQYMGARIQSEHDWYNSVFERFDYNNFLLKEMNIDYFYGYDDYLELFYTKGEINFSITNGGNFQNNETNKQIPLFFSPTQDVVNAENERNKWIAFEKHAKISYSYDEKITFEEYTKQYKNEFEEFKKDEALLKKNGYIETKLSSISSIGCMFMCVKYGLETLLGEGVNTLDLHEFIKVNSYVNVGERENGSPRSSNLLSRWLMATIMTEYSNGDFTVKYLDAFGETAPTLDMLNTINSSKEQYLIHLRIKDKSNSNSETHSVMVSSIEYTKDIQGNITGISKINVANPYNDNNHFNGKQFYLPNEIVRWDYFSVTKNKL
jgi:hypothetical protein